MTNNNIIYFIDIDVYYYHLQLINKFIFNQSDRIQC